VVYAVEFQAAFHAWNRLHDESKPDAMRLPILGGWTEQSPLFIEFMDIIDSEQPCLKP